MNIIPEEPEVYEEFPRPTPGLSNLLTKKQLNFYLSANTSKLFGRINQNYGKKLINKLNTETKNTNKKINRSFEMNKKSLIFLGVGFGILAITKVVKGLTK